MVDWTNLGQSVAGIFEMNRAAEIQEAATENQIATIRYSGQVAAQGAALSAQGLRKQMKLIPRILDFNLDIDKMNLQRSLEAQSRQAQRLIGTQISQIAASGVSLTSGSALQVRNETIDVFANKMLATRIDAENKKRSEIFSAQMQMFSLDEQASVADYNAQLANWNAEVQAVNARNAAETRKYESSKKMWGTVPTLMSELFQE